VNRYKEYAPIRELGFNRSSLIDFFSSRPQVVLGRLVVVASSLNYVKNEWAKQEALPLGERDRGQILRDELAGLGPIFVKIGQTLSQRPDIVGEEACKELSQLQTENEPFADTVAMYIIAKELNWRGPIAPGVVPEGCPDPEGPPLFAWISDGPIASASLGQVYKARLHKDAVGKYEGVEEMLVDARQRQQQLQRQKGSSDPKAEAGDEEDEDAYLEVAVKVQRPECVRQIALDWTCSALALEALEYYWNKARPSGFEASLGEIADEIATGIFQELNYVQEAANAETFVQSLAFLGFVDAPKCVAGLTTSCVLTTAWVRGRHLKDLTEEEGLSLTTMAVEACTASLVLTGYVHADPHEGNLMLDDRTGRIVFLDFGLMSNVEAEIMEAFARGIQACLAEDYEALAVVFQDVGFVGTPLQWRLDETKAFAEKPMAEFATELRKSMQNDPDGTSRFGALATVLSALGDNWRMYTPPYVLLLIRTFLTLEGIAAKVDPSFNIYEVSLPWAIKRSLSPSSAMGVQSLRQALLTDTNQLQWSRLQALISEATSAPPASSSESLEASESTPSGTSEASAPSSASAASSSSSSTVVVSGKDTGNGNSKSARGMEAVAALLGSPEGATLRRIAADLDSTDLFLRLVSREGRPLRRLAAKLLSEKLRMKRGRKRGATTTSTTTLEKGEDLKAAAAAAADALPPSSSPSFEVTLGAVANSVGPKSTYPPAEAVLSTQPTAVAAAAAAGGGASSSLPSLQPTLQETFTALQARRQAWGSKMLRVLLRQHAKKQVAAGWRGALGVASLCYVLTRITAEACVRALWGAVRDAAVKLTRPFVPGGWRRRERQPLPENTGGKQQTAAT